MTSPTAITFEEGYRRLQEIAEEVNETDVPVDRMGDLFAEGKGLDKALTDHLAKQKERIERIEKGEEIPATELKRGDVVYVPAGQSIPADGEILEGIASVDESAITGESAPVVREAGGDRSAVTGGTRVLSDWIKLEIAQLNDRFQIPEATARPYDTLPATSRSARPACRPA